MAKILLSYGIHREQKLASKVVLEVKKRLEAQGHEVMLKRCPHSNLSDILKLSRFFVLKRALSEAVSPSFKNQSDVTIAGLIPEQLALQVKAASSRLHYGLSFAEVERIDSSLKKLVNPSVSPLRKRKAALLRKLVGERLDSRWGFEAYYLLLLLQQKQFDYQARLVKLHPGHVVFDFNSPPLFDLYASTQEKESYSGYGLPTEQINATKPQRVALKNQAEQRFLASFKPAVKHLAGELMAPAEALLPRRILFFHHSGWPLLGREDFLSYHGNAHTSLVSVVFPAVTKPKKGVFQRFTSSNWVRKHTQASDVKASEKAGLLNGLPEAIAKSISRVVAKKARVQKKI